MNPSMIIMVIIGVILLIVANTVITMITTGGNIGDCSSVDYNGDGVIDSADQIHQGYKACDSTRNIGYNILTIIGIMMIVVAVINSARDAGVI